MLGDCPTCPEFNKKRCICGHLALYHSFANGHRTGTEIDVCGSCISSGLTSYRNDPTKASLCYLFIEEKRKEEPSK